MRSFVRLLTVGEIGRFERLVNQLVQILPEPTSVHLQSYWELVKVENKDGTLRNHEDDKWKVWYENLRGGADTVIGTLCECVWAGILHQRGLPFAFENDYDQQVRKSIDIKTLHNDEEITFSLKHNPIRENGTLRLGRDYFTTSVRTPVGADRIVFVDLYALKCMAFKTSTLKQYFEQHKVESRDNQYCYCDVDDILTNAEGKCSLLETANDNDR